METTKIVTAPCAAGPSRFVNTADGIEIVINWSIAQGDEQDSAAGPDQSADGSHCRAAPSSAVQPVLAPERDRQTRTASIKRTAP